ncbi:MAG: uroporphyrinogen-III C-methyltransferase [Acidiferrobacterales bacterium]
MAQPEKTETDKTESGKTSSDTVVRTVTKDHQASNLSGGLSLILSLSALILAGYLWYLVQGPGDTLEDDFLGLVEQVNRLDQATSSRFTAIEEQVADNQASRKIFEQSLDKLRSELGRDQTSWAISETEHLLMIANNRLQLARDVNTAVAALRGADYQLQLLAQPKFLALRKTINKEISTLESLEKIDVPGLAIRLGTIANKVDTLPISSETIGKVKNENSNNSPAEKIPAEKAEAENIPEQKSFLAEFWQDLLSLFRIRTRSDVEQYKPLLTAEQSYIVRENLRLRLYGAQLALLASNDTVYQQNLADSLKWVKQNFDTDSQSVVAVLNELDQLAKTQIILSLPDISGSLEQIRRFRKNKSNDNNTNTNAGTGTPDTKKDQ